MSFARTYGKRLPLDTLEMNMSLKTAFGSEFVLGSRSSILYTGAPAIRVWNVTPAQASSGSALQENKLFETVGSGSRRKRSPHGQQARSTMARARGAGPKPGSSLLAWAGEGPCSSDARLSLAVEARLLLALERHPNIISLHAFVEDGRPMMLTELPDGGSLRDFLGEHGDALSAQQLCAACASVASAMAYLESLSIVHRALSLDAVAVFGHMDTVKIMNFGLYARRRWGTWEKRAAILPCFRPALSRDSSPTRFAFY